MRKDIMDYFCVVMRVLLWNVRVKTHFHPKYLLQLKYLASEPSWQIPRFSYRRSQIRDQGSRICRGYILDECTKMGTDSRI